MKERKCAKTIFLVDWLIYIWNSKFILFTNQSQKFIRRYSKWFIKKEMKNDFF